MSEEYKERPVTDDEVTSVITELSAADAYGFGDRVSAGQALRRAVDLIERLAEARRPAQAPLADGEPSDEVLLGIAAQSMNVYGGIRPGEHEEDNSCAIEVYGSELIAFARAALAHWGHQPEPIPLSERKPGPEDCSESSPCWFWLPEENGHVDLGQWELQHRDWATDPDTDYTHWQPFHAISRPS